MNHNDENENRECNLTPPHKPITQKSIPVNDEVLKYQYLKGWVYQLNKDFYDEINIKLKDLISKNND